MLKYGMIGGDLKGFIGAIHRTAIRIDGRAELVCGCFSRDREKNLQCGRQCAVAQERLFTDWRELLESERARGEDKIDFVSICTPNHLHYEISKAFLEAGINVFCEKPLCFETEEAEELAAIAERNGLSFAVPYSYTGNNMVKAMREMVSRGELGDILAVHGRYSQEWLINEIAEPGAENEKIWRTVPKYSGVANAMGDIGTHLEYIVRYVTGMKIKRLCAALDRYGKSLDYNGSVLVEYDNGVHGNYWVSQVALGKGNGLKIGIYGTEGALEWEEARSDFAVFTKRGEAPRILTRGGRYLGEDAAFTRIPAGHPEGFYCAFANIYRGFISSVEKKKTGEALNAADMDFPTAEDGLIGVKFVHAVVESDRQGSVWVDM